MVHKSEKDYQNFMTKQILSKMASDNKVYTNYVELNATGGISQDLLDEMRLNRKVLDGKKLNVQVINKTDFGFQSWRMSNIKWGK
jgi:beta-N-acetylglucosaminidase